MYCERKDNRQEMIRYHKIKNKRELTPERARKYAD
jgi:hypothetical protein